MKVKAIVLALILGISTCFAGGQEGTGNNKFDVNQMIAQCEALHGVVGVRAEKEGTSGIRFFVIIDGDKVYLKC